METDRLWKPFESGTGIISRSSAAGSLDSVAVRRKSHVADEAEAKGVRMFRDETGKGGGGGRQARNVLGEPLEACSTQPMTGFFRDGCCNTSREDRGSHTVCALVTEDFLAFSKARGNDLSTPMPDYGFPGLKPGDRWCLCAPRWHEAFQAGKAPRVMLKATHEGALAHCALADLKAHAADLS